mmetsp:Transcript_9077/g.15596  ORF Transcript_9077/g.15596 Transcript_9077/m.15596 type:complete len:223 (+) Transcript_9077:666-1334(+)
MCARDGFDTAGLRARELGFILFGKCLVYCVDLVLAGTDVVREREEGGSLLGVIDGQLRLGVVDQLLGDAAALVQAQQGGVRGLAHRLVLACGLAQLLGRECAVQNVINHLEGEADVLRVPGQARDVLLVGTAQEGAAHDGGVEQRRSLVRVDVLQSLQTSWRAAAVDALHLDIHDLPPHQPLRPHALRHICHHAEHDPGVHLVERRGHGDVLERAGQEPITR